MCQRIGMSPTWTSGLGLNSVSSRRRVPVPPQRMTTGIEEFLPIVEGSWHYRGVPRERQASSMKRLSAVLLLALSACAGTDPRQETYERIQALAKDEEAFQELLRA